MDSRRTRGRNVMSASEPPPRARSPGRKSPARRSPARRSPRKSPARKSPARRSPSRKSPSRTKSPTTIQKDKDVSVGRPTRKKPTATVPPTSPAAKESVAVSKETKEKKTSPILTTVTRTPISISPLKRDLKESSSIQSVTSSSYSSSTRTTTKTKATMETVDFGQNQSSSDRSGGDLEVSKLTSIASFIRRSVSKNPTPTTELTRPSRSVSRSVYDEDDNYSKTEYSDNEQENYETIRVDTSQNAYTKKSLSRHIEVPKDYGGTIGAALFLLLVPPTVLYLQYSCNTQQCRFKSINLLNTTLATVSSMFDRYVTGAYISFLVLVHLLSSFPFGRVVILPNERGTVKYYFNSILASLVIGIGLGVAQFLKYPIGAFIWKSYFKLSIVSTLVALSIALCCYIRARKAPSNALNPFAKSGNFLIDFFLGREIVPKWFGVIDIKLACYRTSIIAMLIYSSLLIARSMQLPSLPTEEQAPSYLDAAKYVLGNIRYDAASLFSSSLLAIYTLDLILNEHHLASSFDLQQEGVGALVLLRYAITPFLLGIVPRYILLNKPVSIPIWGYVLVSLVFLLGIIIKRASSSIKYQYRMNPQHNKFHYVETVPTFQGRRLLLDKWWGTLRQPNYIGDILSLLAYCAPVAWDFAYPPVISVLLVVIFLIHRAIRVNARNYRRYDSPWARYCSRVRYLLVPKVF